MKKVISMFLVCCMILLSTVPAYAKENDKPISNLLVSQNELALELSHYFAEDSNGDIHFTATKSDLRRLGIFDKDAEIMLSFTSQELNVFSEQLDNSLVINEKSSEVMDRNYIQPTGFVGLYLHLGPKVRAMSAVPAGAFAAGFVGWHLKSLAKAGPWGAGAAAAISASVGGAVGWAVKNHLKKVPVGKNIPGVSWSANVYIP